MYSVNLFSAKIKSKILNDKIYLEAILKPKHINNVKISYPKNISYQWFCDYKPIKDNNKILITDFKPHKYCVEVLYTDIDIEILNDENTEIHSSIPGNINFICNFNSLFKLYGDCSGKITYFSKFKEIKVEQGEKKIGLAISYSYDIAHQKYNKIDLPDNAFNILCAYNYQYVANLIFDKNGIYENKFNVKEKNKLIFYFSIIHISNLKPNYYILIKDNNENIYGILNNFNNVNSIQVIPYGSLGPFKYRIYADGTLISCNSKISLYRDTAYTFEVYDSCGNKIYFTIN